MLLEDDSEKRNELFQSIMQKIVKNMIPIRPGRSKVRKMGQWSLPRMWRNASEAKGPQG